MALSTRFTKLFEIDHPIMMGGMNIVGRAELVAAVANAGGLAFLGTPTRSSPEELVDEIRHCHALTDRPFGVNFTILHGGDPAKHHEYRRAIVDGGVRIVETAGSKPAEHVEYLKQHGIKIIHKCTSVRHALAAERIGVDAVAIVGFGGAGHSGEDDVPGLVLVPIVADKLGIPVVAAGGFADGRGLAAALALGADGIAMGTRFCATQEAPIHENFKRQMIENDERATILLHRGRRNTMRAARNAISEEINRRELAGAGREDVVELVSNERASAAYQSGDVDAGLWGAGISQGLIQDTPTVKELIERTVADAEAIFYKYQRQEAPSWAS